MKNIALSNIDGVAVVTLDRAEKHNAFNESMIEGLTYLFTKIASSDARVMVLEAEGSSFSAGADLAWMQRTAEYSYAHNLQDAKQLALMLKTLNSLPIPTIAKINGPAYGGAVGLVACCDIAIGSENSLFCLSEAKVGLIPSIISPYVITAIGQRASRRYFQTAETIDAETALRLGLLSELVSTEELDLKTQDLVQKISANSPTAVKAAKKLVFDVAGKPLTDELLNETVLRIASIRGSAEGQEGLRAFLEKRPPYWMKSRPE